MEPIKYFKNNSYVFYGRGAFDEYCVYLKLHNEREYAPKDFTCFQFFKNGYEIYGDKIYRDFVSIYEQTSKTISNEILEYISEISETYREEHKLDFDIWYTVLYLAMIAEENKKFTKLGKRVKRLGLHQVLFDGLLPIEAANYSKGKRWQELSKDCKSRGF